MDHGTPLPHFVGLGRDGWTKVWLRAFDRGVAKDLRCARGSSRKQNPTHLALLTAAPEQASGGMPWSAFRDPSPRKAGEVHVNTVPVLQAGTNCPWRRPQCSAAFRRRSGPPSGTSHAVHLTDETPRANRPVNAVMKRVLQMSTEVYMSTRSPEDLAHRQRCKSLPPMQVGEAKNLVAAFLASKSITLCPTRYAAPTEQGFPSTRCGR